MDWSDDLGVTWNVWMPNVDYNLALGEDLYLRFSITADAGSDHSVGLAVGLVLTESAAPFPMGSDYTKSGTGQANFRILDSGDLVTELSVLDFGTITQGVPSVYLGSVVKCINTGITMQYSWTVTAPDVSVLVEYSTDGGVSWSTWNENTDSPYLVSQAIMHLRFTITADALAEHPTGLTVEINFDGV